VDVDEDEELPYSGQFLFGSSNTKAGGFPTAGCFPTPDGMGNTAVGAALLPFSSANSSVLAFFSDCPDCPSFVEEEEEDVEEGADLLTVDLVVLIGATVLPLATSCWRWKKKDKDILGSQLNIFLNWGILNLFENGAR
jgi:hypothetical protein